MADERASLDRRVFLRALGAAGITALTARTSAAVASQQPDEPSGRVARALSDHRISSYEVVTLQDVFPRPVGPMARGGSGGTGGSFQACRLTTDQGASGWAMSGIRPGELERFVGTSVGDLFEPGTGPSDDVSAFTMAVWDLVGNIVRMPVSSLLGSRGPTAVPMYSAAIYMEDLAPQENPRGIGGVLDACRQDYKAGYRAFKLKIGRGRTLMPSRDGLARDIAVTRAVREKFPDCRILVDANDAFTVEEAIEYVRGIADCDVYWIEEPFPEQREDLERLREAMTAVGCTALIADGESGDGAPPPVPTAWGFYAEAFADRLLALAERRLVDVFVMDLGTVGFTRWTRLLPTLAAAGIQASPHLWMWTPRSYYGAQLAVGCGNIPIVEGIPGRAHGIDYSKYRLRKGAFEIPGAPGFGLTLRV